MSNRTKKARADALKKAAGTSAFANTKNQHITKISAKPSHPSDDTQPTPAPVSVAKPTVTPDKPAAKPSKPSKTERKTAKKSRSDQPEKLLKEVFLLARPFVALGRYLRDSWREIRQVRWPNRKNTWKMTLAVLAYCAVFIVFIMLLDTFFTFLFKTVVK